MAHGERRQVAELSALQRAAEIDQQLPAPGDFEARAALFVLVQARGNGERTEWPEGSEWFDSESDLFLTATDKLVQEFGGRSSTTTPHRLIDGVENSRCFWFGGSPAASIAAAQAVRSLIHEYAIGQKAQVRLGIGRHGYAASNVALNVNAESIGFDGVLWEQIPADEQPELRRMVVTDPKINRRAFRRAFERYVSQVAPELVGHQSE